jgi:hypothetical protein
MTQSAFSKEEIAQRGKALYRQRLAAEVETVDNIGKIIAIDLDTQDYEIDTDLIVACDRLKARHPNAVIWIERVGYDAVYAVGGTLVSKTWDLRVLSCTEKTAI